VKAQHSKLQHNNWTFGEIVYDFIPAMYWEDEESARTINKYLAGHPHIYMLTTSLYLQSFEAIKVATTIDENTWILI